MDCFNTNEDPQEWDSTAWRDGHCARMAGNPMHVPTKFTGGFRRRSWEAGWTDADAGVQADRETAEHLADEVGSLRNTNVRLRTALRELAEHCEKCGLPSTPVYENALRVAANC